jgi:hypothetical protein
MCSLAAQKIYREKQQEAFCSTVRNSRISKVSYIFQLTYFFSWSFYFNYVYHN